MCVKSKANRSRLEKKCEGLRPREYAGMFPAPRRPFDAIKIRVSLASLAGNKIIPRQKKHAPLATLAGNHIMHPFVFAWQKSMTRCVIGK